MESTTEQEEFWRGSFGDDYTDRNTGGHASNVALFFRVLAKTRGVSSIFEIGVNRGLNMDALSVAAPNAKLSGVEINSHAAALARTRHAGVLEGSILSATIEGHFDLVFTKGVLIHIAPEKLPDVYARMSELSSRYVLIAEYYNPQPVAITYRGHSGKLFKRDFAGEFMDKTGFELIDYGFVYRRDPVFPADDISWFLMERRA